LLSQNLDPAFGSSISVTRPVVSPRRRHSSYLSCSTGKPAQPLRWRNPPGTAKHSSVLAVLPLPSFRAMKALQKVPIEVEVTTAKCFPFDLTAGTAGSASLYHNRQGCNYQSWGTESWSSSAGRKEGFLFPLTLPNLQKNQNKTFKKTSKILRVPLTAFLELRCGSAQRGWLR